MEGRWVAEKTMLFKKIEIRLVGTSEMGLRWEMSKLKKRRFQVMGRKGGKIRNGGFEMKLKNGPGIKGRRP